ncbi:MAG: hypothetical protein R3F65_21760 [bacterium]
MGPGRGAGYVALGAVVVVGGEQDGRAVPTAWRARLVPAAAPGAVEEGTD